MPPTTPRAKSETRQRQSVYGMRFTDAERAEMERRASAAGFQSVADMVRARCLKTRPLRARLDVQALLKVEAAIHRIGVNVNQIAARVNAKDGATAEQLAAVTDALEQVYSLVDALHPER